MIFSSGTTTLAGTYNAANTTLSGGALNTGSNGITFANFTQTGGTLTGTGTVTVTGSASLGTTGNYVVESGSGTTDLKGISTLIGNVGVALDGGRVLQNDGTLNWTSSAIYMGYNPLGTTVGSSTIVNSLGATFNDAVAGSISNNTGTNVFNNAGTFETTFSSGTTTIGVAFNNTGTVTVGTGDALTLSGGGASTGGSFTGGGTLQFITNGYNFNASSTVSTANVIFSSGTTTLAGTYNAANTTLSGGALNTGSTALRLPISRKPAGR